MSLSRPTQKDINGRLKQITLLNESLDWTPKEQHTLLWRRIWKELVDVQLMCVQRDHFGST